HRQTRRLAPHRDLLDLSERRHRRGPASPRCPRRQELSRAVLFGLPRGGLSWRFPPGRDRNMEPTTRHEDDADRLRLVDVRLVAGQGRVDLSGGLAGVLTDSGERSAAARWIASTVTGP